MDKLDFQLVLAVVGAFVLMLVMRVLKGRGKKEDVMDEGDWL